MILPKVFLIILNWNRFGDTFECLKSIDNLDDNDFRLQVVVVDNASSDGSLEKLQRLVFEKIKLEFVVNKDNLGFAAGNNRGIEYALHNGADYIVILNNDTIVDKDLIASLLKTCQKDNNIFALSPKIYFAKGFEFKHTYREKDLGKIIWYAGGLIDWNNVYGQARGVDQVDEGQFNQKTETDFATGACLFLPRETINTVGMFDQKFYMYYEDTDLSQRIKLAGKKVVYDPSGVVWHKVAQSSGIGSNLNDYFTTRNRLLFGFKYAPLRTKLALVRESIKFLFFGRPWQKIGARDFYLRKFGKGSFIK